MPTDAEVDALHHSGIYAIVCEPTGKRYIGQAANIPQRWIDHRKTLRGNRHKNSYLQRAYNKYGEAAFSFRLLESCDVWSLTKREQHWIDRYSWGRLFNLSPQAGSTIRTKRNGAALENIRQGIKKRVLPPWTDERRAAMAQRSRNIKWTVEKRAALSLALTGVKRSAESCANIAAAAKRRVPHPASLEALRLSAFGRVVSAEARQRMSKAAVLKWQRLKARGYQMSDETRLKLSLSHRGKKHSAETKKKMSLAKLGKKMGPLSAEHKAKIGAAVRRYHASN